ncbi:MAG: SRPBCC domain-containing protein [Salinibacterium sp.]|nr:SRPBCC domain-containing protein [Salinibacterium sp.]
MEFYEATTTIDAKPESVWEALVDGASWPTWDSGVNSVDGVIAPGNKITIKAAVGGDRAFPVKVVTFDAPNKLVFSGGMPLGLFRGMRTYTLTPDGAETLVHMREEYTGAMLGAIWKSIPDLGPSFQQFVSGLKKRVESRA